MICTGRFRKKCARVHIAVLGWNKSSIDYYKHLGAIDLTEVNDWHVSINRKCIRKDGNKE